MQWFRAEAEFFRWLEQLERRHFDFLRLIRSFARCAAWWDSRALEHPLLSGYRAFASRQARVYRDLREDALTLFQEGGHPFIIGESVHVRDLDHCSLLERCLQHRDKAVLDVYLRSGDEG